MRHDATVPDEKTWEELRRLRDWRHDVAAPELIALRNRLHLAERRLDVIEAAVSQLVEADRIAAAVTEAFRQRRGGVLTRWQRIGAVAVALAAVVSTGLQIAHLFG